MKRLLLLALLTLSACVPAQVDIPATAKAAIAMTDAARPTATSAATATAIASPTAEPSPAPSLDIGATQARPKDGATMMFVPAGQFQMGYDHGLANEAPVHPVYLDGYWIDKTEVTMSMYKACIEAGACNGHAAPQPSDRSPVVDLSWEDAHAYCTFVGARLPTEAEWEKAAAAPMPGSIRGAWIQTI